MKPTADTQRRVRSARHTPSVADLPYASLLPAAAAIVVAMLPHAPQWLQYDRAAIAMGELWRLVSGHWTHVSADHLFWDVLMFAVLGMLCEQESRIRYTVCVVGATLLIPLTLWITLPDLITYRGLSGIDSALFLLLAVMRLKPELRRRHRGWVAALAGAGLAFVAKLGYELATGGTLFVDSRSVFMVPVPLAHGVGAVVGLITGLAEYVVAPWHRHYAKDPDRLCRQIDI